MLKKHYEIIYVLGVCNPPNGQILAPPLTVKTCADDNKVLHMEVYDKVLQMEDTHKYLPN